MSATCQRRHCVRVSRYFEHRSADIADGWRQVILADRKARIPDLAAFRIDFPQWLQTLSRRDRGVINALTSGERTKSMAERFGLSEGRVSLLRRKFEKLWLTFQGEAEEVAA